MFVAIAAVAPSPVLMVVAGLLFATAEGSTTATLQATLSEAVAEDEQGGLAGGLSAIGSAAGLALPLLTGLLYAQVAPAAPYLFSLGAIIVALALTVRLTDRPATLSRQAAAAE
jgi:DHA1 family tetracycline resistance protein-like MFS transporter